MDKPTNTWLHAKVGIFAAFAVFMLMFLFNVREYIWINYIAIGACLFFSILVEAWQYDDADNKTDYLKRKWLDITCDLLAGNGGFIGTLWLLNVIIR